MEKETDGSSFPTYLCLMENKLCNQSCSLSSPVGCKRRTSRTAALRKVHTSKYLDA